MRVVNISTPLDVRCFRVVKFPNVFRVLVADFSIINIARFLSCEVIDSRVGAVVLVLVRVITFSATVRRNLHNFRAVEVSSFLANCCWYITIQGTEKFTLITG